MVATSEGSGAWGAVMAIGVGILKKKSIFATLTVYFGYYGGVAENGPRCWNC